MEVIYKRGSGDPDSMNEPQLASNLSNLVGEGRSFYKPSEDRSVKMEISVNIRLVPRREAY